MGSETKRPGNFVRQAGKHRGTANKHPCDDPLRSTGTCSPGLQPKTLDRHSATGTSGSQIGQDSYSKKPRPIAMQDRNGHHSINRSLGTVAIRCGVAVRQKGYTFSCDVPPVHRWAPRNCAPIVSVRRWANGRQCTHPDKSLR